MTPDVRERASEAVDAVMNTVTHDYGEMLFAVVDAVAEVLAAADAQRNAQLTAEVEVAHAYRAEWGTLRAQLESAEECYVEARAVAARRGQERDTLQARVAEQEIAFAEKLAGVTDASTRHVKQLSERVDRLTAALTGLSSELLAAGYVAASELVERKWREVLSATRGGATENFDVEKGWQRLHDWMVKEGHVAPADESETP